MVRRRSATRRSATRRSATRRSATRRSATRRSATRQKHKTYKQHGGALTPNQQNLKYYYLEIFRHPFNDTLINVKKEENMLNARLDEIGEEKMNTPATIIPGEELIRPYRNRFSSDSVDRRGSVRKRYY